MPFRFFFLLLVVSLAYRLTQCASIDGEALDVHVVFSTDCSPYQHWQALLLLHSARAVRHQGTVTRILCGCDAASRARIAKTHAKLFPNSPFRLHFAPDYSSKNSNSNNHNNQSYVYFNKSWGLRHFLFHGSADFFDIEDAIVAVVDPDFLFLRPLAVSSNNAQIVSFPDEIATNVSTIPSKGHPVGQLYAFGEDWAKDFSPSPAENVRDFQRRKVCGENSPCVTVSEREAKTQFQVGSPYIAVLSDLRALAITWSDFALKLFDFQPIHLSEMFAYAMAAAHLRLPHRTFSHFMVSNVFVEGEGWPWIDALEEVHLFHSPLMVDRAMPTFVHYCQQYALGEFVFSKYSLPTETWFDCSSDAKDVLVLPSADEIIRSSTTRLLRNNDLDKVQVVHIEPKLVKRLAFVIYTLHRNVEAMITDYRKIMCEKSI